MNSIGGCVAGRRPGVPFALPGQDRPSSASMWRACDLGPTASSVLSREGQLGLSNLLEAASLAVGVVQLIYSALQYRDQRGRFAPALSASERAADRWSVVRGVDALALILLVLVQLVWRPVPTTAMVAAYAVGLLIAGVAAVAKRRADRQTRTERLGQLLTAVGEGGGLPLATKVNRYDVGVARSHYAATDDDRYIPRHKADTELDDAIAMAFESTRAGDGQFVLVLGPSKAGKSRTALEAVCRIDGALLLAPRQDRLAMVAESPPPAGARGPVVLWLDDLERYLSGPGRLTQQLLQRLRRAYPNLLTMATMTTRQYMDLVEPTLPSPGSDDDPREVVERARTVSLEVHLTPEERARAQELYPREDFRRGPGEQFVVAWAHDRLYCLGPQASSERWAVIQAAIDWRRAGIARPIPRSALRELAHYYLPGYLFRSWSIQGQWRAA
jgi:hypothetical protein